MGAGPREPGQHQTSVARAHCCICSLSDLERFVHGRDPTLPEVGGVWCPHGGGLRDAVDGGLLCMFGVQRVRRAAQQSRLPALSSRGGDPVRLLWFCICVVLCTGGRCCVAVGAGVHDVILVVISHMSEKKRSKK